MLKRTWTPAVYDLLETLTCRVRLLSLAHVQHGWAKQFGNSGGAVVAIQRLVNAGLIAGDVWNLPISPIGEEPLAVWTPLHAAPDFMQLTEVVQTRWDKPTQPTPVVAATHKAARLFGSSAGGLPPTNHRNHDLLLAAVYIRYRLTQPKLAKTWLGEDAVAIAERGVKNPDAFLFDDEGHVTRVIESAGRYSLEQIESFHRHCQSAELPYELW
ncbi:hypothetical protein V7x_43880 [Crateriforma conspicua]|uniref:Uncharacterized protein n=1 Tax=Crateriforma conspicua TaxID=2527996 RepID=A0A5C6FQB2_9PLAN|nr:hypothetical protein [Crateriforma conspicua]TWU62653.1 hypothetical protein V7x_43880 [Crateriforma conspicua]